MNSILQNSLESSETTITAEVMPPRGGDASKTLAAAKNLLGKVHATSQKQLKYHYTPNKSHWDELIDWSRSKDETRTKGTDLSQTDNLDKGD